MIWTALSIMKMADGASGWDLGLTVFCGVLWIFTFVLSIVKYRKQENMEGDLQNENET